MQVFVLTLEIGGPPSQHPRKVSRVKYVYLETVTGTTFTNFEILHFDKNILNMPVLIQNFNPCTEQGLNVS